MIIDFIRNLEIEYRLLQQRNIFVSYQTLHLRKFSLQSDSIMYELDPCFHFCGMSTCSVQLTPDILVPCLQ